MIRFALGVVVMTAATALPCAGLAQRHGHHGGGQSQAQAEYQRAVEAYRNQDYRGALEGFQHAQELAPDPPNLYNIARCYDRLSQYREAADYLRQYLGSEIPAERREAAQRLLDQIRVRPGEIEISSTPPGATVFVDRDFDHSHGVTPVTIELAPGSHEITLRLTGRAQSTRRLNVDFASSQPQQFELAEETAQIRNLAHDNPGAAAVQTVHPEGESSGALVDLAGVGSFGLSPQVLAFAGGGGLGGAFGFGRDRAMRVAFDAEFLPTVNATLIDGVVSFEYAIAVSSTPKLEIDLRIGGGGSYLTVSAPAGMTLPVASGSTFMVVARAAGGFTYRLAPRWAFRGLLAGVDVVFLTPRGLAGSTTPGAAGTPIIRYHGDVAIVYAF